MRDKVGAKFQTVLYKKSDSDYEGVVSVENKIKDAGLLESSLIYWTTGAIAGCDINKSNTNKKSMLVSLMLMLIILKYS